MESRNLSEELLETWLYVSAVVSNRRMVSRLSANEAIVCNLLLRNGEDTLLTATDLCRQTKLLKSQMNRTVTALEQRGMLIRSPHPHDKRRMVIKPIKENMKPYFQDHEKIIGVLAKATQDMGEQKTKETIENLREISSIMEHILSEEP